MQETLDLDSLALAVDERVQSLPAGPEPARLYGVQLAPGRIVLVPFWSGVARELPPSVAPPAGCIAIALATSGWAAPLDSDGVRPSRHPQRRRMHQTTLVAGRGDDLTVLRYADCDRPQILRGAVGVVADALRACWARNPRA